MTTPETPEVAANLERARESLEAARTLVEAEHFDDATSRAYYATFYAATAALLAEEESEAKRALKTAERLVEALGRFAGLAPEP